jgi:hypothetical protein
MGNKALVHIIVTCIPLNGGPTPCNDDPRIERVKEVWTIKPSSTLSIGTFIALPKVSS